MRSVSGSLQHLQPGGAAGNAETARWRGGRAVVRAGCNVLRRWRKGLVGLDIGSSAVKAAELRRQGRAWTLAAFGAEPLPAGAVDGGAIADRDAVVAAVRRLLEGPAFTARSAAVALAGNAVMVRRISLPAMSREELDGSIYWEARQHIPFPVDEVALDYQVLDAAAGERDAGPTEVLLVAARRDHVAAYADVVERAGCTPAVIDVGVLALSNAYALNYDVNAAAVAALLDVGAASAKVTVVAGSQPLCTRELLLGGRTYMAALRQELGVEAADAEQILQGRPAAGLVPEEVSPIIRSVNARLVAEIASTLELFRGALPAAGVGSLVLCGGASRVAGLAGALADGLEVGVAQFDPFRRLGSPGVGGRRREEDGPLAAVAVGLALRRAGDR